MPSPVADPYPKVTACEQSLQHCLGKIDLQKIAQFSQMGIWGADQVFTSKKVVIVGKKLLILVMQLNDTKPENNSTKTLMDFKDQLWTMISSRTGFGGHRIPLTADSDGTWIAKCMNDPCVGEPFEQGRDMVNV